ncbi:unnamed protein product [Rhizoctonia solani]|uniref:Uncharacterized protein n=1 Tax=Rhizoctonia solani TaxID=456999 RepID=A0A8H3E982_9AGAM|nr:unnamed protein product [Rhizoctonia solani]
MGERCLARRQQNVKVEEEFDIGTAAATITGRGVASTLKALEQQGILSGPDVEVEERERLQKQKRVMAKDQSAREYENRVRDQQEARDTMESFKDYKLDVELKYYDNAERELATKEAWKALSHRFHGKDSGRAKMEIAKKFDNVAFLEGVGERSFRKAIEWASKYGLCINKTIHVDLHTIPGSHSSCSHSGKRDRVN